MKYDLFISHSSADAEAAVALVNEIESRGILKCWIAPRDIPIGASYQREIVRAIANCGGFVLLFSRSTNESNHVLREIELAEQNKKAMYPVKIDASEPAEGIKYYLASAQWVERKALGNRLVETIEQMVASAQGGERPAAPPPPAQPAKKSGTSPMLIGAAAVVLLLLVGGGMVAWQQIEARRLAYEEQVRKEQEVLATAREQERRSKEKEERDKRAAEAAKQEEEKKKQQAAKEEEEKKKQQAAKEEEDRRKARLVNLPVTPSAEITIQKTAPTVETAVPGKTFFQECDICPVMAVVPPGSNLIGSPKDESGRSDTEGPQQPVVFRLPLAVGRSEISFEEYIACVNESGCQPGLPGDYGWGYGKQPVINISWNQAKAYVGWLSRKTGGKYRLLSEAEWEYAARGCAKVCPSTPFWFGSEINGDRVNYDSRLAYLGSLKTLARRRTVLIDSGEANPFGLLNVHGNVSEWVEDCWQENLVGLSADGTARTGGDCSRRVLRGGSWADEPKDVRSAARSWEMPTERRAQIGFRVARELKL